MLDPGARHDVESLVERLRPFVARRLDSAADVDDVLQDVLLRMQARVHELRNEDRFGPWLYRVVRNVIADQHRARARHAGAPVEDDLPEGPAADTGATEELVSCLAPFIARLPSPYREAITLVDLEGASARKASAMLGISVTALKSRVQRGRKRLRELFDECCRLELDVRQRVVDYECRSADAPACCRRS